MKTINITTTPEGNLSYSQSGEEEIIITTPVNLWVDPTSVSFRIDSEVRSMSLSDVITINSVGFSGTLDELKTTLEGLLPTASGGSGGSGTAYKVWTGYLVSTGGGEVTLNPLGTPTITELSITNDGSGSFYFSSPDFLVDKLWAIAQPNKAWGGAVEYIQIQGKYNTDGYPEAMLYSFFSNNGTGTSDFGAPVFIEIRAYL
jgi:hypothetical protein